MHIARAMEKMTLARQRVEKSLEQHWSIFDSIKARDKTAATEAVIRNIGQLRSHFGRAVRPKTVHPTKPEQMLEEI